MATLDLSTSMQVREGVSSKEILGYIKNQMQTQSQIKAFTIIAESDSQLQFKSKFYKIPAFEGTFHVKQKDNTVKVTLNAAKKAGMCFHIGFWVIGVVSCGLTSVVDLLLLVTGKPLDKLRAVFNSVERQFEVL
jgi:hypothetical protein